MAFELSGKLIEKYDTQQVSDKFRKREFVIEKSENNGGMVFTDQIKFQLTQDRCDILDGVKLEEDIKVLFNIRGRKWEKDGKVNYFTNLEAWKIEKEASQETPFDDVPPPTEADPFESSDPEATDDLPF
jgi:hypothetical protein